MKKGQVKYRQLLKQVLIKEITLQCNNKSYHSGLKQFGNQRSQLQAEFIRNNFYPFLSHISLIPPTFMHIHQIIALLPFICLFMGFQLTPTSNQSVLIFDNENRCIPKCLQCQKSPNTCTKCSNGADCCNWACSKCQNQTQCLACKYGFQLDTQLNLCVFQFPCFSGYCAACDEQQNVCLECVSSYFLNIQMKTCEACSPRCIKCQNSYECMQCQDRTFKQNGSCKSCIQNCRNCSNSNVCQICDQGYFINQNGKCQKCIQQCKKCSTKKDCAQCNSGYYFDDQAKLCVPCLGLCLQCKNQDFCTSCKQNSYLNKTSGECLPCNQMHLHCQVCFVDQINEPSNLTYSLQASLVNNTEVTCVKCEDRYYLDQSQCKPCAANCIQCKNFQTCKHCAQSYFLNNESQCQLCRIFRCRICNQSKTCQICEPGFYWNPSLSTYQCTKCPMGCESCDQFGCLHCSITFYLENGNCYKCDSSCAQCLDEPSNCQICLTGYFKTTITSGNCYKCPQPCIQCTNLTHCTRCMPQYYVSKSICKKCKIEGCEQCKYIQTNTSLAKVSEIESGSNGQKCYRCSVGYFLKDSLCNKCIQNCSKCFDSQKCFDCFKGFYLNEQATKCLPCGSHCLRCNPIKDTLTHCTSCQPGFTVDISNLKCLPCLENCLECIPTAQNFCLHCKNGFYPKPNNDGSQICVKCKAPCKQCEEEKQCLSCIVGYYLNSQDQCIKCQAGCEQCSEEGCFICEQGFRLQYENSTCSKCKVDKCSQCQTSENTCDSCEDGYQYYAPSSIQNDLFSQSTLCFRCDQTMQGCKTCDSPQNCLQCFSGLTLIMSEDGLTDSCQKQNQFLGFFIAIGILALFVIILTGLICFLRFKYNKLAQRQESFERKSLVQENDYSINSEEVISSKSLKKSLRSSFESND